MSDGWELTEFPTGTALWYRDSDHRYHIGRRKLAAPEEWERGPRLTSVSTLVKPLDFEKDKLLRWAARENGKGIAIEVKRLLSNSAVPVEQLEWLTDHETIWARLESKRLTFNDIRDAKADLGTLVHELFETLALEGSPDLSHMDPLTRLYASRVIEWWDEKRPEVVATEQFVLSYSYGYAGRFDLLAWVEGKLKLIDLKTSKWIGPAYHAQLAGYEHAGRECGVIEGECEPMVLQVSETGWSEVKGVASETDFLNALYTYRASRNIEKRARAA